MSATLHELKKASDSLQIAQRLLRDANQNDPNNIDLHKALRDSCIQRFEFCVELSWKISIKLLGLDTKAPNPAIRDMAQNNLIDDPQIWFEFLLARNKTSHTYDEDVAKEVYREVERLIPELEKLLEKLAQLK
ncbi:HI0074 family nucleotidyltransferase substrate-binding subunit [Bdellovibrio bacteriovorus]|uniref:HI0074 family nucleotidyltransferase substrate-binding subunit n=1 Tax=Bdellovibrio TaxID=958 RepID=UPI0035A9258F